MKALDKIKDMIDFCDAVGCHRALYESLKAVESELEALQSRSCESCRHWDFNEQGHFKKCFNGKGNVLSTKGDFCCNRYEAKEQ